MKDGAIDFTRGSIVMDLIAFTLPLFLGNLFQQLYNAADSLIVGNFLGREALAAVSSSGNLIFMMVGFFNGLAVGAGVVIARACGARDEERISKAVHTDIAFGIVAGLLLTVFAVIFTPGILRLISTPPDIMPSSIAYFRVYSAGIMFSVLYNILMGIMNAAGDSRHPLYYLMISSVVNIVLDVLFIGGFGMGVGSAAAATIISQALSSILCFASLLRSSGPVRVQLRLICFDRAQLKAIVSFGFPAGVQNSVIGLANTVVQRSINAFPAAVIAGAGVYSKIEGFILLPITSISLALTTLVGQNLGAREYGRAVKGARRGVLISIVLAEAVGALLFILAPPIVSLFSSDADVIAAGARQARLEAFFYFLVAISHGSAGILRGAGKSTVPMMVMLSVWCVFRVIYVNLALLAWPDPLLIYSAYPLTWAISSVIFLIYLARVDWLHAMERHDAHLHRA